jgi:hypothetical protein
MLVDNVEMYDTILRRAVEKIYTYERKYTVSVSALGDMPPHGDGSTVVLKPRVDKFELDTVWQRDRAGSVVNLPNSAGKCQYVHKTRSRFLWPSVKNKEYLHKEVSFMEKIQVKMYNEILDAAVTSLSYRSIFYPNFSYFLEKNNITVTRGSTFCTMSNNAVYAIGTPKQYDKMNAGGYQLLPSEPWKEGCRGCGGDDTFIYIMYALDPKDDNITSDATALQIYYQGTQMMINRLKVAHFIQRFRSPEKVNVTGKYFEEGDAVKPFLLPYYKCVPGMYIDASDAYMPPTREAYVWPRILPGFWPRLGLFGGDTL